MSNDLISRKAIIKELREIMDEPHDAMFLMGIGAAISFIEHVETDFDNMKNEEDILKFYYCESEDDYYLGQRVEDMYYARYGAGAFTWFMSRYLPWNENGYPSEPKEIPFLQWIEGVIRKHINAGWIPVEERLPEEDGFYIATMDGEIVGQEESFVGLAEFENGLWVDDDIDYRCIIAWRPLPEPYRPKKESEGSRRLREREEFFKG